jgi:Coenzyme PQQ synthesis protein D (PqqD)
MDLTLDHRVSVSRDAIFRDINGEAVVLDLEAGVYYGLDEVGTCAWRALEDGGPLRRAFDVVLTEFDVDAATAERDLLQLAQALIDKRLWTLG